MVWVAAALLQVDQVYPTYFGMSKEQDFLYSVLIKSVFLQEKEFSVVATEKAVLWNVCFFHSSEEWV